jgi:cysteinyl-tRNA synthetase
MLQICNSLGKRLEIFKPLQAGKVKMYTCGPSIYQKPHIGNYRTFLYEDILQRYLEYSGYQVERALNLTDVEDKAISEALKEGKTLRELTDSVAEQFFEDMKKLRIKPPTYIPRSSTSVEEAVQLIMALLEKGYAYWDGGDIFYDPLKFKGFGRLYGLDMSRWPKKKRHFRKDTYPGVQWNLGDFILWHGYKAGDPVYWDTEIGRGRPAWNVQDAAMATRHLGPHIDVCCGGIDNLYRHHDYTLAIVEAVHGGEYAHYWLHGEHLLVDGKKMSKSKGNVIYLDDLLTEGYRPEQVRFYLIYRHYRRKLNFTRQRLKETSKKLEEFQEMAKQFEDKQASSHDSGKKTSSLISNLTARFEESMNNDLNVKLAFDNLFKTVATLTSLRDNGRLTKDDCNGIAQALKRVDGVLQVIFPRT